MAIERTLFILKPDACHRSLEQKILRTYIHPLGLTLREVDFYKVRSSELDQKVALHYNKGDPWCLNWGEKKREAVAPTWDSEIQGSLLSGLEFGHAIRAQLYDSVAAAPLIIFVYEGHDAVARVRDTTGATDPIMALPGTIRGGLREYHVNISSPELNQCESIAYAQLQNRAVHNLIHASDSVEEAEREIAIWFPNLK